MVMSNYNMYDLMTAQIEDFYKRFLVVNYCTSTFGVVETWKMWVL